MRGPRATPHPSPSFRRHAACAASAATAAAAAAVVLSPPPPAPPRGRLLRRRRRRRRRPRLDVELSPPWLDVSPYASSPIDEPPADADEPERAGSLMKAARLRLRPDATTLDGSRERSSSLRRAPRGSTTSIGCAAPAAAPAAGAPPLAEPLARPASAAAAWSLAACAAPAAPLTVELMLRSEPPPPAAPAGVSGKA